MFPKRYLPLAICLAIPILAGAMGSLFTTAAIPTWYAALVKPAWNPPASIFGPVWTSLYTLMGLTSYLVWQKGIERKEVQLALGAYGVQLVLNVLWSFLFFGQHNPFLAFIDIVALWLAILVTVILFARASRLAAVLFLPYLLWVSFAGYLNYAIWTLNK
jgi:benzodiazapine receptor